MSRHIPFGIAVVFCSSLTTPLLAQQPASSEAKTAVANVLLVAAPIYKLQVSGGPKVVMVEGKKDKLNKMPEVEFGG